MKKQVAVFFGGRSAEHDVSIITGLQLMDNADIAKYDLIPVYITREGAWFTGEALRNIETFKHFDPQTKGLLPCWLSPVAGERALKAEVTRTFGKKIQSYPIDVAIPAMHGMHGEDGTLQGLFELADIPYVGPAVLGSACGMDKIVMKSVFRDNGIPVLDAVAFDRGEFELDREGVLDRIEGALPYPIFVKPANLGSSIGISKATDRASLREAVEVAIHYDHRILAEKGVNHLKEVNCSVLGIGARAETSELEEPVSWKEFLTFEEKYMRGGKDAKSSGGKGGMASLDRKIPAEITPEQAQLIREISLQAFAALDCCGVVRIDYIIDLDEEKIYLNEINTLPGSFAFYLWEPKGMPYRQLIDRLVELAQERFAIKTKNAFAFQSALLQSQGGGAKGSKR